RAEGRGVIQAGQAAQGAARPMYESTQGRGYEQFFFAEERAEAARGAMEQSGRQRVQDRLQALNPFGGGANFVGMMGGAAVGAKLGAITGAGFGMGFGAVPGAAIGGMLGGAAGLLAGSATNERNRLSLFDSDNYDKLITAEGMKDFEA